MCPYGNSIVFDYFSSKPDFVENYNCDMFIEKDPKSLQEAKNRKLSYGKGHIVKQALMRIEKKL